MTPKFVIFVASLVAIGSANDPIVSFEKVFGDLKLTIGSDPEKNIWTITCQAEDAQPGHFEWTLGDEYLDNADSTTDSVSINGGDIFKQSLDFKPTLEASGKALTCTYVQEEDGVSAYDSVNIEISEFIGPASPHKVPGDFSPGQNITLPVEFKIFPAPTAESLFWTIDGASVDQGEKYKVSPIEALGEDKYQLSITIINATKEDTLKDIQVVHKLHMKNSVKVEFSLDSEDGDSEDPQKLGAGIWILLGLVIVIILICIAYCIWQKFFRKVDEPEPRIPDPEKGSYSQAPTKDETG